MSEVRKGEVIWFGKKGYGFIAQEDDKDMFVHWQNIVDMEGFKTLTPGQWVEYEVGLTDKGLPQAVNVKVIGE